MQAVVHISIPEDLYRSVARLLETLGSQKSVNATIHQFIEYGIENAEWKADVFFPEIKPQKNEVPKDRYKWKHPKFNRALFLPNGTQLKMEYPTGTENYATIKDGQIMHNGKVYDGSPSALASKIASNTSRSAPRDFFIKRPNDLSWTQAKELFEAENKTTKA